MDPAWIKSGLKIAPRRPQDAPKTLSRRLETTRDVPKTLQNDALSRRARTLPKTLQEASQTFPNLPRRPPRVLVRSCLSWFGSVGPGSVLFVLVRSCWSWFGPIDPVCPGSVLLFLVRSCWSCFGAACPGKSGRKEKGQGRKGRKGQKEPQETQIDKDGMEGMGTHRVRDT